MNYPGMILLNYAGEPDAKLMGLQADVPVRCIPVDQARYRCSYTAEREGTPSSFSLAKLLMGLIH